MEEEGAPNGRDAAIILVPKSTVDLEALTSCKKKLKRACTVQGHGEAPEHGKIVVEASRLSRCSAYFATCLSERWTPAMATATATRKDPHKASPSLMEFRLELHAEPRYYHDCFSRMNHPFLKPIPNVAHCVQLLKVASQIEYHELMDICVKYLSAVPWSRSDENELREFCHLGQLSFDATADLRARLRFPLTEEARQKETVTLLKRMLSRYMKIAFSNDSTFELFDSRYASREVFAGAFHALVSCEESSQVCHEALQHALVLSRIELEQILVAMAGSESPKGWESSPVVVTGNLLRFCWLFEVLRVANAAQVGVELLLKHDVSRVLLAAFDPYAATAPLRAEIVYQWGKMMYSVFHDVLDGRLFLKTSERVALFQHWNWILKKDGIFSGEEPPVSKIVAGFILSFPHAQQEEIFLRWASDLDEYPLPEDYDLSDAHTTWMTSLVSTTEMAIQLESASIVEHKGALSRTPTTRSCTWADL